MLYIKMVGYILIICSCSGIGMHYSNKLKNRISDLREIKKLIYLLKGDIRYAHTPLPEAVQSLSFRHDGKFKNFLTVVSTRLQELGGISFYTIWKEAIGTELHNTSLSNKDLKALSVLGESLGYLDKDMQINTLELYIEQIEVEIHELSQCVKEKSYMYNALGILGGIFIIIIIV